MLPVLVALLVAAGIGCLLWRPQYAIVVVIAMFPIEQLMQSYFPPLAARPILINAVVACIAAAAALYRFMRAEPLLLGYSNWVVRLVWTLYALTWVGLLLTPDPSNAIGMMRHGLPYYVVMIGILPLLVSDLRSFQSILVGMMVVGATMAALVLVSPNTRMMAGRLVMDLGYMAASRESNPLALAEMGGAAALVAVLYRATKGGTVLLGIRVAAIVMGLGLAVSSGSRGQVIAAVGAALICFPLSRPIRNAKQFVLGGAGILVLWQLVSFVFSRFVTEQGAGRWDTASMASGMSTRMDYIRTLAEAWQGSPVAWILGLGTNAFFHLSGGGSYPHNFFAEILFEHGLVGTVLVALIGLWTMRYTRDLLRTHAEDPPLRSALAILVGLSVYTLLLSLKQGTYIASPGVFMYPILIAKIAMAERLLGVRPAMAELAEDGSADETVAEASPAAHESPREARAARGSPAPTRVPVVRRARLLADAPVGAVRDGGPPPHVDGDV